MNLNVKSKFDTYPNEIKPQLETLRQLIFDVAKDNGIEDLTESLKWGEPSFSCETASAIRLDWKAKTPDKYYLFFNCKTKLIDTFKELFPSEFNYQGNRSIELKSNEPLELESLKTCILLSLRYKKIKHLPLLGM